MFFNTESKKAVAIIPARGGSKGIPGKNLKNVGGRSLIERSISCAMQSRSFSQVLVSTDNEEIAKKSILCGAKVVPRDPEISSDDASSELAIIDCIQKESIENDCAIAFIQATSPFCTPEILRDAMSEFFKKECDSMVSVYKEHGFYWNGNVPMYDPANRPMRQEQANLYKEAGMFYIFRAGSFMSSKNRIHGTVCTYSIPKMRALEIDEAEDLILADLIDKSGLI